MTNRPTVISRGAREAVPGAFSGQSGFACLFISNSIQE